MRVQSAQFTDLYTKTMHDEMCPKIFRVSRKWFDLPDLGKNPIYFNHLFVKHPNIFLCNGETEQHRSVFTHRHRNKEPLIIVNHDELH